MSKDTPKEDQTNDIKNADDRLFGDTPLADIDPDTVVTVEGEASTGFETPAAAEPEPDHAPNQDAPAAPAGEDDDLGGLPPAAVAAIRDERRKRQDRERELEELRRAQAQPQAQPAPQPQAQPQQAYIPNPATDPQGYHNFMSQQVTGAMRDMEATSRLNTSRFMAQQAHGAEVVQAAEQAFHASRQSDPAGYAARFDAFGKARHPIGEIVQWYQQQQLMSEIGDDPEAYKQRIREQVLAEMGNPQPPPAPTPQSRSNLPPRVASTPGVMSGGSAQHTMDDAEANLWGR